MKASRQVFILLINLCLCHGSDGAGNRRFVRKEAIVMTPTGVIESIPIKASKASMLARVKTIKTSDNRHSTIEGKIEQGGKCLAARRHSLANPTESGDHELELVACSDSDDDDEEWEAPGDIETGSHTQIELADDGLCLQADHHHHHVHLRECSNATLHTHHHRQLWTYDSETNEIKMAVRTHHTEGVTAHKCLTSHDHDSDGDIDLILHTCSSPTPEDQDWVFDDGSNVPHSSPSSAMIEGKLKQHSKCVAAHKTSNADEDLEVVDCGGDGDDDEEWEANAEIKTDHATHMPQQIKLESSSSTKLCLQADSLFDEVELHPCHTHTRHHRQLWQYDPSEEEVAMKTPSGEMKCLESSADVDGAKADEDGPDDDLVLAPCATSAGQDLEEQEWKWE